MSGGMGRQVSSRGFLSGVSLSLLSDCRAFPAWILMTSSQFSLPLRLRFLEANQSRSLVLRSLPICLRWFFSSDSDGGGFRNSRIPLLSESLPLTKIWGGVLCKGRSRGLPAEAQDPQRVSPASPANRPHTSAKRACSAFVRVFFFSFFRVLFQNWLILRS